MSGQEKTRARPSSVREVAAADVAATSSSQTVSNDDTLTIGLDADDETRVTEVTVGGPAGDTDGDEDDDGSESEQADDQPVLSDAVLSVQCGSNEALFHVSKFARGSRGACILYKDEWITPNEFQFISGRESCKDWKRSIRYDGRPMKRVVTQGLLKVHPVDCICTLCQMSPAPANLKVKEEKRRRLNPDFTPTPKLSPPPPPADSCAGEIGSASKPSTRRSGMVRTWAVTPFNVTNGAAGSDSEIDSQSVGKPSSYLSEDETGVSRQQDPEWTPQEPPAKKRRKASMPSHIKLERPTSPHQNGHADGKRPRSGPSEPKSWMVPRRPSLPFRRGQFAGKASPPSPEQVAAWGVNDVMEFVAAHGFSFYAHRFVEEEVDGEALLDIREEHLLDRIQMRLGPALRLYRLIRQLQCP